MFTGLVECVGTVKRSVETESGRLIEIAAAEILEDVKVGDSISIDGVCQTVVAFEPESFSCEAVGETLEKTTLGGLCAGNRVNLERAMRADTRLGGHMVQGHVSAVASVSAMEQRAENWLLRVRLPSELLPLIVPEGSITIQGVSLTIAAIDGEEISINIVPHTAAHTTLATLSAGDGVNIETDIIGRYVARMIGPYLNRNNG